jgi:hypothetical protein
MCDLLVARRFNVADESHPPLTPDYRSQPRRKTPPRMGPALWKALPGALCWLMLFAAIFPHPARGSFVGRLLPFIGLLLPFWLIAVLCAIHSIDNYWATAKPWYVWLNWTINLSGLALSIVGICYLIGAMILR